MKLRFGTGLIIGIALGMLTALSILKITVYQAEKAQEAFIKAIAKGGRLPLP